MKRLNRPWVRGALTLGILAALAAGLMLSPVGAAGTLTKSKVKKIAKKQVTNDNNTNEGIFATFKDAQTAVPNTLTTIATLSIPAGRYAIFAKVHIEDTNQTDSDCRLQAGGDFDIGEAEVEENSNTGAVGVVIPLEVAHTAAGTESVELQCNDGGDGDDYSNVKIIAIRGPSLTNTALT